MVCGTEQSLNLQFVKRGENSVLATIDVNPRWQGYAGVIHGGMVSTLLDAAMTHCLFSLGIEAMTASLNVRFEHPTPCIGTLEIRARLRKRKRHVYFLEAELFVTGARTAYAEASFITWQHP